LFKGAGFTIVFHIWIDCTLIRLVPSISLSLFPLPHYSTATVHFIICNLHIQL
jgi:hypothetical protein